MNRKAVRFRADRDLPIGTKLRLVMAWPARLPDGTSLNLWIFGAVTRSANSEVEVLMARHEFRTRRAAPNETRQDSIPVPLRSMGAAG